MNSGRRRAGGGAAGASAVLPRGARPLSWPWGLLAEGLPVPPVGSSSVLGMSPGMELVRLAFIQLQDWLITSRP